MGIEVLSKFIQGACHDITDITIENNHRRANSSESIIGQQTNVLTLCVCRKAYNLMIHERSHDTVKYSADIYKLRTELQACNRRDIRYIFFPLGTSA